LRENKFCKVELLNLLCLILISCVEYGVRAGFGTELVWIRAWTGIYKDQGNRWLETGSSWRLLVEELDIWIGILLGFTV